MRFRPVLLAVLVVSASVAVTLLLGVTSASAHQSGCHRWHSCPSDTGSYVCGDLGYACQYPTYPTNPLPDPTYTNPLPDLGTGTPDLGGSAPLSEYLTKSEVRRTAKSAVREKWGDRPRRVVLGTCRRLSDVKIRCRIYWRWHKLWKATITVRETADSYLWSLR